MTTRMTNSALLGPTKDASTETMFQRTTEMTRIVTTPAELVAEYCRLHNLEPFVVSEVYDLARDRLRQYPNCGKAGCYFFFDASGWLIYVGVSGDLGYRLGQYFHLNEERTMLVPKPNYIWRRQPRYLQTVATRNEYEAPSLEAYLIDKLQSLGTLENTRGIERNKC
jgi:GIY-YIG catalytic domain